MQRKTAGQYSLAFSPSDLTCCQRKKRTPSMQIRNAGGWAAKSHNHDNEKSMRVASGDAADRHRLERVRGCGLYRTQCAPQPGQERMASVEERDLRDRGGEVVNKCRWWWWWKGGGEGGMHGTTVLGCFVLFWLLVLGRKGV